MPTTNDDLKTSIDKLIEVERANLKSQSWWRSVTHGIFAGIGGTVGVGLVLALLSALLNHASVIPIVGHWLNELTPYVQSAVHR